MAVCPHLAYCLTCCCASRILVNSSMAHFFTSAGSVHRQVTGHFEHVRGHDDLFKGSEVLNPHEAEEAARNDRRHRMADSSS